MKMTVAGLMSGYKRTHPDGHWFDEATLEFFGEKTYEMHVSKRRYCRDVTTGEEFFAWILTSRQRARPGRPLFHTAFDAKTFEPYPEGSYEVVGG